VVIVKEIIRTYYSCEEDVKLDIDISIQELTKQGILSDVEVIVLAIIREQYSLSSAGELLGISKSAVGRALNSACSKISDYLGNEYKEEKLIKEVESKLKRKLTEEEVEFCWVKLRDFGRNKYSNLSILNFKDAIEFRQNKEQG